MAIEQSKQRVAEARMRKAAQRFRSRLLVRKTKTRRSGAFCVGGSGLEPVTPACRVVGRAGGTLPRSTISISIRPNLCGCLSPYLARPIALGRAIAQERRVRVDQVDHGSFESSHQVFSGFEASLWDSSGTHVLSIKNKNLDLRLLHKASEWGFSMVRGGRCGLLSAEAWVAVR